MTDVIMWFGNSIVQATIRLPVEDIPLWVQRRAVSVEPSLSNEPNSKLLLEVTEHPMFVVSTIVGIVKDGQVVMRRPGSGYKDPNHPTRVVVRS